MAVYFIFTILFSFRLSNDYVHSGILNGQSHWLILSLKMSPGSQQTSVNVPLSTHWQKHCSHGPSEWYGPKPSGTHVPYLSHLLGFFDVVVPGLGVVTCYFYENEIISLHWWLIQWRKPWIPVYKASINYRFNLNKCKYEYLMTILIVFIANRSITTINSLRPITISVYGIKTFLFSIDWKK